MKINNYHFMLEVEYKIVENFSIKKKYHWSHKNQSRNIT